MGAAAAAACRHLRSVRHAGPACEPESGKWVRNQWQLVPLEHTRASLLSAGTLVAGALASGAARGLATAGRLAAPVLMALLKTLAFTRLFA